MSPVSGISAGHRGLVSELHRAFPGPFSVADATELWGMERRRARRLLAHLAARGWLTRVRRGWYSTVPLAAAHPGERKEDPWLVAWTLFSPGYLGGWTACEHWGLTEQIFSDLVVFTTREVRDRNQAIQGTRYILRVIPDDRMFGLAPVWRESVRVQVSDPSRTVVDVLNEPALGGGIRHVAQVILEYFRSDHRDDGRLVEFTRRMGNRTIAKRLGFILESCRIEAPQVTTFCRSRVSAGYSKLDPDVAVPGRFMRRWNLEVNVSLAMSEASG